VIQSVSHMTFRKESRSVELQRRRLQPELMDAPDLDEVPHLHALDGLRRIHFWSRTSRTYIRVLQQWISSNGPLRVLDLACGGGDVILSLEKLGQRAGLKLLVDGCDVSRTALDRAVTRAAGKSSRARFFKHDVLKDSLPGDYDVLISSLFLHHLTDEEAGTLLQKMARSCRLGFLVSDLERRPSGYWLAATVPHLLTRSPVVHSDSVKSVRAAFRRDELALLAREAGLCNFELSRCWPCRMLLAWRRPRD